MNLLQNPKTKLVQVGLVIILCADVFFLSQNEPNDAGQTSMSSDFSLNLPLVTYSTNRVPGFVPPVFASSAFEVPVALPACDEAALIINEGMDLSQIDWNAYDVFCLLPGDYSAWGELLIEDVSGTAVQPKVLRYYDPANVTPPHPVERAGNSGPEAVFLQFRLKQSDYWIVDGLTIRNSPDDNRITDSSNNIFNRLLIEGGDGHLFRIERDSDDNVVQNSVIRDQSAQAFKDDSVCLLLYTQDWDHIDLEIENTRIVNNEIYDCADGITLLRAPEERPAYYPGTLIANNDIYITSDLYTDCLGNPDPNGACACSENAIDIKATIMEEDLGNPAKWVRFINNRTWGFRYTDKTVDLQNNDICASGSLGTAIISHMDARGLIIQGNVIMDSANGITGGGAMESDPPITSHYIVNNLIYNIHDCYDDEKQGLGQFVLLDQGQIIGCEDENGDPTVDRAKGLSMTDDENGPDHFGNIHYGNTLINVGDVVNETGRWGQIEDAAHSFYCNAILNSAGSESFTSHVTNIVDRNAYYNSVPYCPMSAPCETQNIIDELTVEAAKHTSITFLRKQWTGPEAITIPDVIPTAATPNFAPGADCWSDDPSHPWN